MKKTIMLLILLIAGVAVGQEKSKNKNASFPVKGNCEMCKKRIEKAAFATKGVKMAAWDQEDQLLRLVFNEYKTDVLTVQQNIAAVGHTTQEVKTSKAVYDKLHACCQYEAPEALPSEKKQ